MYAENGNTFGMVVGFWLLSNLMVIYKDLTEMRDTTYRIPALRGGILYVVSRCYVLNQLGNATSDPTAFKIPQVPSSILAVLGLFS